MVKLEEVVDEEFQRQQTVDEDDWDTDSESDASSVASLDTSETLYDRITALKDILPASTRKTLSSSYQNTTSILKSGLINGGKTIWVVGSSVILLGVPWALAYAEEQQMVEMEREMKMQQSASDLLTAQQAAGGMAAGEGAPAKPAL